MNNKLEMPRPLYLKRLKSKNPNCKPVYIDNLPPCNAACPAGENAAGQVHAG